MIIIETILIVMWILGSVVNLLLFAATKHKNDIKIKKYKTYCAYAAIAIMLIILSWFIAPRVVGLFIKSYEGY